MKVLSQGDFMKTDPVQLEFSNSFVGSATSPSGRVVIGDQPDGMMPYHLLYAAAASCFYATFLSVAQKKRLTFTRASMTVTGVKRDATPPTLETMKMVLTIYQGSDQTKLTESAHLGAEYCSIHETISKVAKMELEVLFVH
jgi:putative redox protein